MSDKTKADVYRIVTDARMTPEQKTAALKAIATANTMAQQIQQLPPTMGPLGGVGDTHLRPDLAPVVPAGAARPYAPGEFTMNPDGSWSSERSMTVQNPDGSWSVIPSLWLKGGRPYEAAGEDEASKLAAASKLPFKKFKTLQEADKFSIDREAAWQPIENPADADKIAPLWSAPTPAAPIAAPTPAPAALNLSQAVAGAQQNVAAIAGTNVAYPALDDGSQTLALLDAASRGRR